MKDQEDSHPVLPLLLAMNASAQSANATLEEVAAMVEDLVPRIEAHAGRSFGDDRPDFAFSWHNKIWPRIEKVLREDLEEADSDVLDAELKTARMHLEGAVALYMAPEDRVYVMADGVYELFEGAGARDELFQPMLKCTLAHELTHALQARQGLLDRSPSDPKAVLAQHAALEGHANWVARQVCRELELETALGLMDGGQGIFALQAQGPSMPMTALMYGASRAWMDQLHESGGHSAQWEVLQDPPVVHSWLRPTLEALPDARWPSADVLTAATRALGGEHWRKGVQGSMQVFGQLGDEGLRAIPHLNSSWAAIQRDDELSGRAIAAFAFDDPAIPVQLIEARARQPSGRPPGVPDELTFRYDSSPRFRQMTRLVEVDRAARWSVSGYGVGWWEFWVARDDVLVVVLIQGERTAPRVVAEAIGIVLDAR